MLDLKDLKNHFTFLKTDFFAVVLVLVSQKRAFTLLDRLLKCTLMLDHLFEENMSSAAVRPKGGRRQDGGYQTFPNSNQNRTSKNKWNNN
ncbi:10144_t:CDS:2, partial [Acaulospora morrowiae]